MLSLASLRILADPARLPATRCQQACALLACYDLTRSTRLELAVVDQRFGWPGGTAARVLAACAAAGLLEPLRGRPGGRVAWARLAAGCRVAEREQQTWLAGQEAAAAREALVAGGNALATGSSSTSSCGGGLIAP